MNILEKIVETVKERVDNNKREVSFNEVRKKAEEMEVKNPFSFHKSLSKEGISFICEVKKASPSKGVIADDFDYKQIAVDYEKAGADAVSCLTEPYFFLGSDKYLMDIKKLIKIPVLRKDFIINEYMVYQSSAMGADAVLLIAGILDKEQLKDYLLILKSLNMNGLVEVHDGYELEKALYAGSDIVGVNNRDLKTFNVDINNSINLSKLIPDDVLFISESGIRTYEDVKMLSDSGADGVLIGETLMREQNKSEALKILRGGK